MYILLNKAGGYRRAKVVIQNLQVIGLQYQEVPVATDDTEDETDDTPVDPPML